jgi:hypothetical protein
MENHAMAGILFGQIGKVNCITVKITVIKCFLKIKNEYHRNL